MKFHKLSSKTKSAAGILGVAAVIGGFLLAWGFVGTHEALATSANLDTSWERQVIVLDPGHGGMDGGCVSVNGTPEKGINLAISMCGRDLFNVMGFETVCTREKDVSIHDRGIEGLSNQKKSDMQNRLKIFNGEPKAISLSIHQNQFTDGRYSGAQMFYSETSSSGERLAESMQKQFVSLLQPENTRETKPVGDELYLIHNTENPALMIECGFLSNQEEAAKLESEDYQRQVAFTILTGVFEFTSGDTSL